MRHPTKAAIAYASGERVRNAAVLMEHLAGCEVCRDRVAFVQQFMNTLQTQSAIEREKERMSLLYQKHVVGKAAIRPAMKRLTSLEIQVISCAIHGMGNKQIAKQIGASEQVIKYSLASAFDKIQVSSRSELARFATSLSPDEMEFFRREK